MAEIETVQHGAPIVEVVGLSKNFGGARVINGVDMRISKNEVRCVIGPNGAGKSTFFKLLTGEHFPTAGEILFRGKNIKSLLPHERIQYGMSIKFQIPGVFPELTVMEHLELSLFHNRHGQTQDIFELAQKFSLERELRKQAGELAHGKKQWLEMAMAVSLNPELLLLDEPVAGLSVEETWKTGELIKRMRADGLTIMVVEHDMSFVRQIATQVTVLHGGSVFADGLAEDVLARDDVADIYLGNAHE